MRYGKVNETTNYNFTQDISIKYASRLSHTTLQTRAFEERISRQMSLHR